MIASLLLSSFGSFGPSGTNFFFSSININTVKLTAKFSTAQSKHGRKKGLSSNIPSELNKDGNFVCGKQKKPPMSGPTIDPVAQATCRYENPIGRLVWSVISVRYDLITPILPLRNPDRARPITAWWYDLALPNTSMPMAAPDEPMISAGFLPYLSDMCPQSMDEVSCAAQKAPANMPAK